MVRAMVGDPKHSRTGGRSGLVEAGEDVEGGGYGMYRRRWRLQLQRNPSLFSLQGPFSGAVEIVAGRILEI